MPGYLLTRPLKDHQSWMDTLAVGLDLWVTLDGSPPGDGTVGAGCLACVLWSPRSP